MTVEDLGTILGVWAHPDDEAYLSAGLMARARDAGQRVVVITATHGEQGTAGDGPPPPPAAAPPAAAPPAAAPPGTPHPAPVNPTTAHLASVRRRELAASLAAVGVTEHHWLGLPDGGCAAVPSRTGVGLIARFIAQIQPDTIVTFGPDGMTGHPDHRTISAWTTAAWQAAGSRARLLYATVTPRFHAVWGSVNDSIGLWLSDPAPATDESALALAVNCTGPLLERKSAALRAHASQTAALAAQLGEERFRRWWAEEAFAAAPAGGPAPGAAR